MHLATDTSAAAKSCPEPGPPDSGAKLRYRVLSYSISAIVLAYVVWQLRLDRLLDEITGIRWPSLLMAVSLGVASVAVQSLRWWFLMRRGGARYSAVLQATYLGSLVNQLLPLRPGEVIRGVVVSRRMTWPLAAVFSTEAFERVCDAAVAAVFIWVAVGNLQLPAAVNVARGVIGGGAVVILVAVTVLAWRTQRIRGRLLAWCPTRRFTGWAKRALLGFTEGLEVARNWKAVAVTLVCAVGMVLIQITIIWLSLQAYRIDLDFGGAAALLAIITTGTLLPSAPGNIGSWQFFCMIGLAALGTEPAAAAGFSVVAYAVLSLASMVGGIVALAASPFSFADLRRIRRHKERALPASGVQAPAPAYEPEM